MADPSTCELCGRPLGLRTEQHHWRPRSHGGRETAPLHPICHRVIHTTFSEAELARHYDSPQKLLSHEAIARFVRWVKLKPPDFHKPTVRSRRRPK